VPAATPKREAVRARMLETVWVGGVSFGLSFLYVWFCLEGYASDRAMCLTDTLGQLGGGLTRALWPTLSPTMGLSASSRSSSMVMTEDKMSPHGFFSWSGDSGPRGRLMLSDDVRSKVASAGVLDMSVMSVKLQCCSGPTFARNRTVILVESGMSALLGLGVLLFVLKCLEAAACDAESVLVRERFGFERLDLAGLLLP
jgi:hypothetical protein